MEEQILAVQRMQDYIEAHLDTVITQAELAEVSLYSPWYSYRLFVRHVGMTTSDYTRRLRLSRSALKLRDERIKVTDIAFEMGFGSVDGYQRAFFREFGCNPGEYAMNPVPICLFTPYGVKYRYIRREKTMGQVKNVFIQVIEKPRRKALVKRGVKAEEYFSYCEEVGCDVWGLLTSIRSITFHESFYHGLSYGGEPVCLWLPKKYVTPGTSVYVQGVEVPVDYGGVVPEGFDVIEFPPCRMLMFQGEPFAEEDYCEAIDQVREAIGRYEPSAAGYQWDRDNPRIQLEPVGTRGYIELLPVKPI